MAWTRVNILAEGHAEVAFLKVALVPYFASHFDLQLTPMLVMTNRKHHKKGGLQRYAQAKTDIERLISSQPEAYISTMFDLFRLPKDFPNKDECTTLNQAHAQVECLERAFAEDIGSDMFIPYIQLHEFEALLYCDLDVLTRRIEGSNKGIEALKAEVAGLEPEAINSGEATAPSKRLIKHVPIYERSKNRVGGPAAAEIPLSSLRANCPHFGAWLGRLEALSSR